MNTIKNYNIYSESTYFLRKFEKKIIADSAPVSFKLFKNYNIYSEKLKYDTN